MIYVDNILQHNITIMQNINTSVKAWMSHNKFYKQLRCIFKCIFNLIYLIYSN